MIDLKTLKSKLAEWFSPQPTAVQVMMQEIRQASRDYLNELKQEQRKNLVYRYYYRVKWGWKEAEGIADISAYSVRDDGSLYALTPYDQLREIKQIIGWQTNFPPNEMKILVLCEIRTTEGLLQ